MHQVLTKGEVEDQVPADYDNVSGKIVLISEVQCYNRRGDLHSTASVSLEQSHPYPLTRELERTLGAAVIRTYES
jgi:hypothetical protein